MRAVALIFAVFIALPAQAASVHHGASPSYAVELQAAKIIKGKCKSCKDTKIRAAILKLEATKGPYTKAAELARDALKSAK